MDVEIVGRAAPDLLGGARVAGAMKGYA